MQELSLSLHLGRLANLIRNVSEKDIRSDVTLGGRLMLNTAGQLVVTYTPFEHIQLRRRYDVVRLTRNSGGHQSKINY